MKSQDVVVYAYAGCSTCRNALRWLDRHGAKPAVLPITERPPSAAELVRLIDKSGLPARKWWNTSGEAYRALVRERGKDAVAALGTEEIAALLCENGKRIKRPVLVAGDTVLVGFDPDAYERALGPRTPVGSRR